MAGGDGAEIHGLAYLLLRGPTQSVMASLWEVGDAATAELFSHFYRALSQGRTFHESLALAQRAMLEDPAPAHPALWAPFFLMGAP
jgi:CHAT domain-containing protein